MTRSRIALLLVALVCTVGIGVHLVTTHILVSARDAAARTYLTATLEALQASTTVQVRGRAIALSGGRVAAPSSISLSDTLAALRIASAWYDVRTRPLFDTSDTDPMKFTSAVTHLESSIKNLVGAQDADGDRARIAHLYPVAFLKALATQEAARRVFIASASDVDLAAYQSALDAAVRAAQSDLSTFSDTFNVVVGTNKVKLIGYGGLTDTSRMRTTLSSASSGFTAVAQEIERRRLCYEGHIELCTEPIIATSTPRTKTVYPSPTTIARANSVRILTATLRGIKTASTSQPVLLASSRCLAALGRPHLVTVVDSAPTSELQYIGDIFLIPTDTVGETTSAYMHTKLGIPYSLGNPFNFYICQDGGIDTARARATLSTAAFARSHPKVATKLRAPLLRRDVVAEKDARDYLAAALMASTTVHVELRQLQRMFTSGDAGLDTFVEHVATTIAHDAQLVHARVPFNLKPRNLFLTHSAFASLFQTYNPTFGSTSTPLSYPDSLAPEQIYAHNLSYFDLIKKTSASKLQDDIRKYVVFEQGTSTPKSIQ